MVNRLLQVLVLQIALGALWSVQGAGIIHLKPILCFADCTELHGASGQWLRPGSGPSQLAEVSGISPPARAEPRNARTASQ
jgi:hypothetical protein